MKHILCIGMIVLLLAGCQREEELITGEISGLVVTYQQDFTLDPDQSGVQVSLYQDTELQATTVTDSRGHYAFQDIPYGRYEVDYRKEAFIKTWGFHTVYHAGGFSPTLANFWLNEIPVYELTVDSIVYDEEDWALYMYLKFDGETDAPESIYGYQVRLFASNSSVVSSDDFTAYGKTYFYPGTSQLFCKIYTYEIANFDLVKQGTTFFRLYPLALGQGYWVNEYYPEALGKPSNVISFVWNE